MKRPMSQIQDEFYTESIEELSMAAEDEYSKEDGSIFIIANTLTDNFVPVDVLKKDAWTFKGKESRWRHRQPEKNVNDLIGHVHDSWFDEESQKMKSLIELWGHRDDLKEIQKQVINNEVSISASYKKSVDGDGKIVGIYGREISVTPTPECTPELGCGIESIIQNEREVENQMPDENVKEFMEMLERVVGKQNEERGERIVELESTIETMSDTITTQNESIAKLTETNEALEKKVAEIEKKAEIAETAPIRDEIIKLEKISDEEAIKESMEELSSFSKPQLEKMLAKLQRVAKISAKTSETKDKPFLGENLEELEERNKKIKQMTPEQVAAGLNPNLRQYLKDESNSNKPPIEIKSIGEDGTPFIN